MNNASPLISLMTDFGIKDGNVGVMKGVIWGICPEARIADVSHTIAPQNVREASLILARTAPYFPPGTIHVVVVDPGVGTQRRALAAAIDSAYFVGPDNGIITTWLEKARARGTPAKFVDLDRPSFWLPSVSHVFHGRDVFAPVAAHLARGVSLTDVGSPIADPVLLHLPKARQTPQGIVGEIIHIDHFGNAASNITLDEPGVREQTGTVKLGPTTIPQLVKTFGDRSPGEIVALFGSTGNLIVSVVNGSAASQLDIHVGDPIMLFLGNDPARGAT